MMIVSPVQARYNRRWAVVSPIQRLLNAYPSWRLRWRVANLMINPLFTGADIKVSTGKGAEFVFAANTAIGRQLTAFREFEGAELAAALKYAQRGQTVFDVGANVGLVAIPLAAFGDADVVAFEPLEENLASLRSNIASQGLTNITLVPTAVGDKAGSVSFSRGADGSLAAVSDTGKDGEWPVETLDHRWELLGHPSVAFMKIDVEGYELEVLTGAQSLLDKCHPALLIEANDADSLARISGHLAPMGYSASQPKGFQPYNYLFVR